MTFSLGTVSLCKLHFGTKFDFWDKVFGTNEMSEDYKPRHWCFTHFDLNWDVSKINRDDIKYLIVGAERCPETGKEHFQCYVELSKPMRMKAAAAALNCVGAHFEPRRGTREQARDYCKKEGRFTETGEWDKGGQGRRNDIAALKEDIKDNKVTELELFEKHEAMFRIHSSAMKYRLLVKNRQAKMVGYNKKEVFVLWGPTGTGKTRAAIEGLFTSGEVIEGDYYIVNRANTSGTGSWWDGYDGEKTVIFDEFYGDWMKLAEFLRITDGYPMTVPTKGGHKNLEARVIYFTSNHCPAEWYPSASALDPERWAAFNRRLTLVVQFAKDDELVLPRDGTRDEVGEVILGSPTLENALARATPTANPASRG